MQDYESKRKLLFDTLFQAENGLKGSILYQGHKDNMSPNAVACPAKADSNKMMKFQGQESIFKKPELPISKCLKPRKTPDYQINPHKWKKYSLTDVDTSDSTNTAAAFAFLQEMEIRKGQETTKAFDVNTDKPTFCKSIRLRKAAIVEGSDDVEDKPKLKGSKLVMPEYVIGQSSHRKSGEKRKSTETSVTDCSKLKLTHLFEEDEEDE
uniref:U5 small nuclear ribonucleoprotein TSSC4 n=1 Tax=Tabanus bromius TaxID=304241 RepID=A0A0K8TQZ7_TABBR